MRIQPRPPAKVSSERLEIFRARSGFDSARITQANGDTHHLHSLVAPEEEHEYFPDLKLWGEVIVLAGVGLGYHLTAALEGLPVGCRVILVDWYADLVNRMRNRVAKTSPLAVLSISHDGGGAEALGAFLRGSNPPRVQVVKHPPSCAAHPEFYDGILRSIGKAAPRHAAPPARPRQALLLYGGFFVQPETRQALRTVLNREPVLFRYEEMSSGPMYESRLQEALQAERIDVVISINMKGFDGNGILAEVTQRLGIPVIVWFVDDPRPILLHQRAFVGTHMTALTWERAYLDSLRAAGFGQTGYLPLATDPLVFASGVEAIPTALSFVGTSMGADFLSSLREKFLWHDSLRPLVDVVSDRLLVDPATPVNQAVDTESRRLGSALPFSDLRNRTWLSSFIIHTASMKKRAHALGPLIALGLEIHGDPEGWRDLLGPNVNVHPAVEYGAPLGSIYRASAVNVNVTSCQMPTAVNQRVFDVPAAGGFVLTDAQGDFREMFAIGDEAICYESPADLVDKVNFYSRNPVARQRIITAARLRIETQHTYVHRITEMLRVYWRG